MTEERSGDAPDFESLLNVGFRWPTRGDQPFTSSDQWEDNVYVDQHGHGRLVMMMTGYKKAADLMVAHVAQNHTDGDALVFPIIFNYRQFIELSLKYIITTYGRSVGVEPNWKTHDLGVLWSIFLDVLSKYDSDDEDGSVGVVGQIITEFAKVDPSSFAYRYPVDTKGRLVRLALENVNLPGLADVMDGVDGYFTGCDGYLDHLQSAGP